LCVNKPVYLFRRDAQSKLVEPNPTTSTNKFFNDTTPVVAFCRIWRWPDLNTHLELKSSGTCAYAFQDGKDQICVNPYHYDRVLAPCKIKNLKFNLKKNKQFRLVIPPVHIPISDRAVFDSTTSERFQQIDAMDCLTPVNPQQQQSAITSPQSMQDNFEAMTPTPANTNSNIPTTAVSYVETPFWCSILYYELNQRVGETFHASLNSLVIDGFCDPNASDRFCLGSLTNVNRTSESEACRRMIGHGVRLYYIGGEVFAECLSDSPIFVQSPSCNQRFNWHPATVCKIPPRCNLKIFSNTEFAQMLNNTIPLGYEAVYNLTRICSIRMSFVKGWGEEYR